MTLVKGKLKLVAVAACGITYNNDTSPRLGLRGGSNREGAEKDEETGKRTGKKEGRKGEHRLYTVLTTESDASTTCMYVFTGT